MASFLWYNLKLDHLVRIVVHGCLLQNVVKKKQFELYLAPESSPSNLFLSQCISWMAEKKYEYIFMANIIKHFLIGQYKWYYERFDI